MHSRNTILVTYLVWQSPWLPVQDQGNLHASPSESKMQIHVTSPMNLCAAEEELLPHFKYQLVIVM